MSILAADQEHLAQHFARNVPPIALWDGIPVRDDDPRLLAGAVGWLARRDASRRSRPATTRSSSARSLRLEPGPGRGSLVYLDRRYLAL